MGKVISQNQKSQKAGVATAGLVNVDFKTGRINK